MNFDDIDRVEKYVAVAEAALRELSSAQSITDAEVIVSKSREDALVGQLKAAKEGVDRARDMLVAADRDGDPGMISLVRGHLDRKTLAYNELYATVRAELVQLTKARLDAHAGVALRRQVLDAACDAAAESASQL
ncbi:hypothetical protein [Nocardia sp. alder85J]|uniref:hypothetical protein n=1 Tax=Nocardia sp. alder85J TaxID=2862949 RepID=UPI001CD789F0|nr:hypothetical protein [Nocardia sp. alder85J]MCX4094473.1 hypothetical protein [Nocardia sp. alder85J]